MEILIAGAVSLIVQGIKKFFGTSTFGTLVAVFAVSFFGAAIIFALKVSGLWEAFINVCLLAAGIYALIIKRFESGQ